MSAGGTRSARLARLAAALLASSCLATVEARAAATWVPNPTVPGPIPATSDFNANANWNPAAVPVADTALFGATTGPNISFSALNTTLLGFTFNAGAPA